MNSLGERIRAARLARHLTQEQLARGVATKGFISQVETNRATPSLPKLQIIAQRLGLTLADFTGEAPPQELTYLRKSAELAVRAGEPARALEIVDEGLALQPTPEQQADLYRLRGIAHDALGDLPAALAAQQAAAVAAPPGAGYLNASVYVEMGTVLQMMERFNAAIEANLRALQHLDQTGHGDPALRARLLTNLGTECHGLGQLDQATDYLEQALVAATDAESLLRLANAHMALGVTAREAGLLDKAIEHCNRALELHHRIGEERFANRILNNLGDAHFAAGRTAAAHDYQTRCLRRARELKDWYEVGIASGALAQYALLEGDLNQAIGLARESQAASAEAGNNIHRALSLAVEGQAVAKQGHPELADRHFRRAFKMLAARNAAARLAAVSVLYSDVLRERGDVDRAFAFMRMASERDFRKLPALIRGKPRA
jgi:tetratricopeptide (TPR) repeat protein